MSDIVTGQFQDPMASFQNAFKFGAGIRQVQLQAEAAEQARKEAEAKAAADADRQARLNDFNAKLRNGTATTQDYMVISQDLSKDQNDAMQQGFKALDTEKQQAALKDTGELFAALQSGQTDVALSMMDNHIKALENSGSAAEAQAMKMLRQAAEIDPLAVAGYFGTTLGRMGEDGKRVLDNALALQREDGQNLTGADISLKQAQAREANARADQLLSDSEDAKKHGGLNAQQVIDKEGELRKEFYGRQKAYIDAERNLDNIRNSAKDASGAGDVALVTSFMKMLDPGSVVRETEFASAQDTAGLLGKLRSIATKVQSGQFLTPEQRDAFARLAEKYMAPVKAREENDTRTFKRIVKNYGLNWENVANVEEPPQAQPKGAMGKAGTDYLAGLKAFLKQNNPGGEAKIDAATSLDELRAAYPNGVKTYEGQKGAAPAPMPVRDKNY